jgi:hypothetical protein
VCHSFVPLAKGKQVACIGFEPAEYSGFAVDGPWPDWGRNRIITFEVFSKSAKPISLTVRIDDRGHNAAYHDRFNTDWPIQPKQIPLSLVENAPKGRRLTLNTVRNIGLVLVKPDGVSKLFFGTVTLSR